jgi:hypothetical protein
MATVMAASFPSLLFSHSSLSLSFPPSSSPPPSILVKILPLLSATKGLFFLVSSSSFFSFSFVFFDRTISIPEEVKKIQLRKRRTLILSRL